jgi:hypothetical protein
MPVTDRREPAVYVTIEDASYVAPTLEIGRTVFGVILCDRGPHNRVVQVNSRAQFQKLFGKPNYRRTSPSHYCLDKALEYTGKVLAIRITPEDSYLANTAIQKNTNFQTVTEDFIFTQNSNTVNCQTFNGYSAVDIGDWIYPPTVSMAEAVQVVSKDDTSGYILTLDRKYTNPSTTSPINKVVPYQALPWGLHIDQPDQDLPEIEQNVVYYFYANGAGAYYNRLKVKGVRNTQLERMFTDDKGEVLYKYCFMDIWVSQINDDGTESLVEGPWEVSLIRRTPKNEVIRDISSGRILYIEDVINEESELMRCKSAAAADELITSTDAEDRRLQVMLALSTVSPLGTNNVAKGGVQLENGTDGTGLYMSGSGTYAPSDTVFKLVAQAYQGVGPYSDGTSIDGSIEQLGEAVYPWYEPDYIVSGGFPPAVQNSARALADYRQDCIHLGDIYPMHKKYKQDLDARLNEYDWNVWTSMLYVQYRKIFDIYTGEYIYMTPIYHAIERHLYCDGAYFIAEPVAGIEKGAIQEPIELAYRANHTERGDLQDRELNFTIVEPQGKYFLTQLTTWKRLSILKRAHVAKFVAYIRKVIPTLLKDILQRKATQYWINQAKFRVDNFLAAFLENPALERYSVLKSFTTNVKFDDVRSELNVYIDITPIRAIERINVFIIVH